MLRYPCCPQHGALRGRIVGHDATGVTHLGDVVRALREERTLTVRGLEAASGVDNAIISRLENRQQVGVNRENLARLAQALGTTVDELRRREGDGDGPIKRAEPSFEELLRGRRELTAVQRDSLLVHYLSYVEPRRGRG